MAWSIHAPGLFLLLRLESRPFWEKDLKWTPHRFWPVGGCRKQYPFLMGIRGLLLFRVGCDGIGQQIIHILIQLLVVDNVVMAVPKLGGTVVGLVAEIDQHG